MYKTEINYGPRIDYKHCNNCGTCYQHCPMDVFGWDKKKKVPTVDYPAECSFCCFCEIMCNQVAIDVHLPLHHMLDFGLSPVELKKEYKILGKNK